MTRIKCYRCNIEFDVPDSFYNGRKHDKEDFWCPVGHQQHFTRSPVDILREEKEALALEMQAQLNEANHAKLAAERQRDKAIKEKRKVERRIAHGVCPCCNKTFADLSNHMVTEHKEFRLPAGKMPKQIAGPVQ